MLLCCHHEDHPVLLRRAAALCSPQRQEKAERLSGQHKAASIAAGLLLRHGLFLHGLVDPPILVDAKGRPYLEGNPVFFSLSHSGDYAACAISQRPVGVDIQRVVPISQRAIRRFATQAEQRWLSAQENPCNAAVALWTLKESYLKASGESTRAVFQTSFPIGAQGEAAGPKEWDFQLFDSIEGYCIALCERK